MESYYLRRAAFAALKSDVQHHKHGCLIINNKDGRIVCDGFNHHVHKPLEQTHSIHAEMHALSRFCGELERKYTDCSLLVVRVAPDGTRVKNSQPCSVCERMIQKKSKCIRKVYFTATANRLQ